MPSSPIPDEAPSRLEVALTAFVFPGAGQLMQRRWISATFFLSLGTVLVIVLLYVALFPLYQNLQILLGLAGHTSHEPLVLSSIPAILISAGLLLGLHVTSIADAAIAYGRRRAHYHHRRRALEQP